MTVTRDAGQGNTQAADPQSYSHFSAGGAEAVLVLIGHGTTSSVIVSSVTYGGVALASIATALDTTSKPGRVYAYLLGSGVPSGTQTVVVDRTEATTQVHACSITLQAAGNVEAVDIKGISENFVNPQVTLAYGGRLCLTASVMYSGRVLADMTALSGQTNESGTDIGASWSIRTDLQTAAGTTDRTQGFTMANTDVAFIAIALSEVLGGTPALVYRAMQA